MTDKKKRALSEERLKQLKARFKAKIESNDPETRKEMAKLAASMMGAQMANLDNDVDLADDVPQELREAFTNGYLSGVAGQLATKPSWFTDMPLLARAAKLMRSSLTAREREILDMDLNDSEPASPSPSQELIADAERRALEKLRKKDG